jgi:Lactate dehydrogenase and related dehydrogenases
MRCDVISLHCALSQEGRFPSWHLLSRQVLTTLRPEQVLINAARGGIIDETALLERASQGGPSLIVDCWEGEPYISEALLEQASLATAHVAGYSKDGKWRGTQMLGEALTSFLSLERRNSGIGLPSVSVQLGEHHSMAQAVRVLLGQVYDITTDDALLRRAMRDCSSVERGRQFDRLRRDYRERRELYGAQLHCDVPSEWMACVAKAFQLERKDS